MVRRSIDLGTETKRQAPGFLTRICAWVGLTLALGGCSVDSFLDPSRTGRFEYYSTTTPVLERIDIIEPQHDYWANAEAPQQADLLPRELSYYIYPGDVVQLSIFELYQPNVWFEVPRRVDAGGFLRVPELGDVRAAGLTSQQFDDEVTRQLAERIMTNPQVDVSVVQSGGLRYTVYGFVQDPGVFTLENPNLRLLDALAIAGGAPMNTQYIYVIRQVVLADEMTPDFDPRNQPAPPATRPRESNEVDVEDLIEQLENQNQNNQNGVRPGMLQDAGEQPPPVDIDELEPSAPAPAPPVVDVDELEPATQPQQQPPPPIDVDELEPVQESQQPPIDVDEIRPAQPAQDGADSFIFVEERGEWVRIPGRAGAADQSPAATRPLDEPNLVLDRIIEVDYERLARGESSLNIVIRPNDRIYIDGPLQGLVYIGGEINRPGVYNLPGYGQLTLSRFIDVAGGFAPIAIPERVDLIRKVGHNLEAKIRMNVAAIRQGTEPDIYMKPDDHIIVGTNFWATPLAIIRNGFRATYGFGFLLDRNFGNDVFGVPPGEEGF
jgi:polysaccharide export outer membrane protein